jgi:hypothetical protein
MSELIEKILCSIHNMMKQEHAPVDSSLNAVRITGEVPQLIASRNPNRTEIWIHNAGDQDLYLAPFSGNVSRDLYSLKIGVGDTMILNSHNYAQLYKSDIYGFWDSTAASDSTAMVTEFYI